jgi:GMP synthase (glutamine-hydrolysing)
VCLGAQLLAHAAGAAVYPAGGADGGRVYEVGWAPVRFHVGNAADPVLAGLPAETTVLHWHGDTFDLPRGARLLASTDLCRQQAFQLGGRSFGLQFHAEVTGPEIEAFLQNDAAFAEKANGPDAVASIRRDTARELPRSLDVGARLLGNVLDAMIRLGPSGP